VVVEHVIGSMTEIPKPRKEEALFGNAVDELMLLCGGKHSDAMV